MSELRVETSGGCFVTRFTRRINMKDKLLEIQKKALEQIESAKELSALNDVRVSILGKKGEMTSI
jgi:hypothetical protein